MLNDSRTKESTLKVRDASAALRLHSSLRLVLSAETLSDKKKGGEREGFKTRRNQEEQRHLEAKCVFVFGVATQHAKPSAQRGNSPSFLSLSFLPWLSGAVLLISRSFRPNKNKNHYVLY